MMFFNDRKHVHECYAYVYMLWLYPRGTLPRVQTWATITDIFSRYGLDEMGGGREGGRFCALGFSVVVLVNWSKLCGQHIFSQCKLSVCRNREEIHVVFQYNPKCLAKCRYSARLFIRINSTSLHRHGHANTAHTQYEDYTTGDRPHRNQQSPLPSDISFSVDVSHHISNFIFLNVEEWKRPF